ncbi:MAG: glucosamine-6-phosphate deaminase [Thermodesulfobacteriota bacterium]|nr:glucosamine-6-phosphate deaminase [Thermodesulfobacteriota bacterium]
MQVLIHSDQEKVAEHAYDFLRHIMKKRKRLVLGLASGSTPLRLFRKMVAGFTAGEVDFSSVYTFNLDEYVGLKPDHPQSYHCFMRTNLFDHVNLNKDNVHFLRGVPEDIGRHCEDYEQQIREVGGIDLQILGIGRNGHIGFNEPTSSLASRTRMVMLTQATIRDNERFFPNKEDVPRRALTMGVGTILEAEEILLLATGSRKALALTAMIEGPVTAMCPASALQMHPRVTVLCDEAAAIGFQCAEYYRQANDNTSFGNRPFGR